jgi:hypothetical protein
MEEHVQGLVRGDHTPSRSTLRAFGAALAMLCLVRAGTIWRASPADARVSLEVSVAIAAAVCALALAALRPALYLRPYLVLNRLTFPVRWLAAAAVLATLYFGVISPLAYLMRRQRRSSSARSTSQGWIDVTPRTNKSDYFKQF